MHTAEHILNRTMVNMFACKRSENCHIERKKSKCDFELKTEPNEQQIFEIQQKVNEIISQNLDVTETIQTFNQACNKFNLNRIANAENSSIRIINIGNYDSCPCIGQHVSNTSEIGNFKITTTNYKNGHLILRFKLL